MNWAVPGERSPASLAAVYVVERATWPGPGSDLEEL